MRRLDTKTKDTMRLQGHQQTNDEGHHDTSGHEYEGHQEISRTSGHETAKETMKRLNAKTKDTIGLQGHHQTNNDGHHETSGT